MAIFDAKILREEEIRDGFTPGEPDDDTFFLGTNEYPGDITEFEFKPEPEPEPQNANDYSTDGILDGTQIGAADMSVWDFFDSETANETETIQPETEPIDEPEPEVIVQEPVQKVEEKPITQPEPEPIVEVAPNINVPEKVDIPKEIEEIPIDKAEDNFQKVTDTPIIEEVDQDFINFIQGQLDKSKNKKDKDKNVDNEKDKEYIYEDDLKVSENDDFRAVEETEDTKLIDISKIKAKNPSAYNPDADKSENENQSTEKTPEQIKEEEKEEKKKNRKPFPWLIVASVLAGLALIGTVGYFVYNTFFKRGNVEHLKNDSTLVIKEKVKEIPKEIIDKHEEKKEEIKSDSAESEKIAEKKIDSVKLAEVEKKIDKLAEVQPKKEIEKKTEQIIIAPVPKKVEKTVATKKKIEKHKEIVRKPDVKVREKKEPIVAEEKVHIVVPKKEEKPIKKNETTITKKQAEEPESNKTVVPSFKPTETEAEYTIQIYSSPSREDAEEWLKRLRQKNINDGFISTQKIRDRVFYRVRFGQFKTKEEARTVANRLGFVQSWIDRVK